LLLPLVAVAQPKHQAVLVGINDYRGTGFSDLKYAAPDVRKLEAKLKARGFDVAALTNAAATKDAIEKAVADANTRRGRGDVLMLVMSGHGVQTRFIDDPKENAYFCPALGQRSDAKTLIRLLTLIENLGAKGPNLVLIDACRDRAGFDPNATEGHGVFMYHVLQALEGEGTVTWQQLQERVGECNESAKKWLPSYAESRAKGAEVPLAQLEFQVPHRVENAPAGFNPVLFAAASASGPKPGEERAFEIAPGVKMNFCWMRPGRATLGSPATEKAYRLWYAPDGRIESIGLRVCFRLD